MKQYIIGFITGACLIASAVMFMGAQNQHENLGDITVNSITVLSDGSGGYIKTYNSEGKQTSYLGTGGTGGFLETFDATGQSTSYLGTGGTGGFLETYNIYSNKTAYLGTGTKGYGIIKLSGQNGNLGWGRSGKK
ncbi:MAG TPA: hypothetical protein DIS65_05355 [Candidatus Marinimicrobia bacterium]|jgi:hypothetical protein|nr:hypothetical protein [Candidatus Neomarinimicrobiota bacterium]